MRFLAGAVRVASLVRRARPAPYAQPLADTGSRALAIGRRVRALESPDAAVPMTWGIRLPVVLLPEPARQWTPERRHAVVLHELVHVQRHDLLAQLAAQAACCLYWFHPLVWSAARQMRKERERACDDAVLCGGVAAPDYAGYLLDLARVLVGGRNLADAPAMAEAGDLEERVRAVLDGSRDRAHLNHRLAATIAVLTCALVLPVALVTLHAQAGTGALAGIVQDISHARVPGCAISIKNLDGTCLYGCFSKAPYVVASNCAVYRRSGLCVGLLRFVGRSARPEPNCGDWRAAPPRNMASVAAQLCFLVREFLVKYHLLGSAETTV